MKRQSEKVQGCSTIASVWCQAGLRLKKGPDFHAFTCFFRHTTHAPFRKMKHTQTTQMHGPLTPCTECGISVFETNTCFRTLSRSVLVVSLPSSSRL